MSLLNQNKSIKYESQRGSQAGLSDTVLSLKEKLKGDKAKNQHIMSKDKSQESTDNKKAGNLSIEQSDINQEETDKLLNKIRKELHLAEIYDDKMIDEIDNKDVQLKNIEMNQLPNLKNLVVE